MAKLCCITRHFMLCAKYEMAKKAKVHHIRYVNALLFPNFKLRLLVKNKNVKFPKDCLYSNILLYCYSHMIICNHMIIKAVISNLTYRIISKRRRQNQTGRIFSTGINNKSPSKTPLRDLKSQNTHNFRLGFLRYITTEHQKR